MIDLTVEDVCKWLKLRPGENPFPRIFREMGWPVEAVDLRQRITPKVAVELAVLYTYNEEDQEVINARFTTNARAKRRCS